tara:strand:- start:1112 stop:1363 length:252 start_codon:yes stop_codon:yes gene_type:complete
MKINFIFVLSFFILIISPISSQETNCDEFDKLSAKYLECTAKKMKNKASEEIDKRKKKMNESALGEKINKFKKSKTLSDLIKN